MQQILIENPEENSVQSLAVAADSTVTCEACRELEAEIASENQENVATLAAQIVQTAGQRQRSAWFTTCAFMALMTVIVIFTQFYIGSGRGDAFFWSRLFPALCGAMVASVIGIGIAGLLATGFENRGIRKKADRLAKKLDKTSVGSLVDLFKLDNVHIHRRAKHDLTSLLPTLTASDAHLLNSEQRAKLNRILNIAPDELGYKDITELFRRTSKRETALRLAILKAFEQIGDESSLKIVESLSKRRADTEARQSIKDAAVECLPYLRIRVGQQTDQRSLLRASSVNAIPDTTLLRPASACSESASESLLRPDIAHRA